MSIRKPAVAGQFYPAEREKLLSTLKAFFLDEKKRKIGVAAIVPHAGYIYSGKIAASGFAMLKKVKTYVLLGPNHTGLGKPASISGSTEWETPLGRIKVDRKLAEEIATNTVAEFEESAHLMEHSIEVQLPFMQYLYGNDITIVPIVISGLGAEELIAFGKQLASIEQDFVIVVSSDFSHFVPESSAKEKDMDAIECIKAIDAKKFYELVFSNNLSICGYEPITALLSYAAAKQIKKVELVRYDTSARVTGDKSSVVGYASIIFKA
jgi:hypothetical protein